MEEAITPKRSPRQLMESILSLVVPFLAIGVPVLYVLGRVYKEAYWLALGLPYTILGYSVEEYVYWGFVALANGLIRSVAALPLGPLWTWVVFILLLIIALWLTFVLRNAVRRFLTWLVAQIEKGASLLRGSDENWRKHFATPLLTFGQWLNSAYFTFLMSVLVLSLAIAGVSSAGKGQAAKSIKWLRDRGNIAEASNSFVHLKGQTVERGGAVLECTTQWCVIARGSQFVIVPSEDIASIDGCKGVMKASTTGLECPREPAP